jgi:galactosyl transferase GMA12/MNN10 family
LQKRKKKKNLPNIIVIVNRIHIWPYLKSWSYILYNAHPICDRIVIPLSFSLFTSQNKLNMSPRPFARWPSKHQLMKNQRPWLLFITLAFLLSIVTFDLVSFALQHANSLGRSCSGMVASSVPVEGRPRMAIVSLSNQAQEAVWQNKKAYTKKMGYHFIDASWMVDRSRPPSWSKILAVKSTLRDHDWVFWNDAVCAYSMQFYL